MKSLKVTLLLLPLFVLVQNKHFLIESTCQMAVVQQVDGVLGIAEAPQDIGKKTFVEYVQDWVSDFIFILEEQRDTDVKIQVNDIIKSLREQIKKVDFPISTVLWNNLRIKINKLPSPTTAEELRGALLDGFKTFNTEMGNKFVLTKHYKENASTYRKIKKKNLNDQVMIADEFETWLNGVLEKAEKEQRELEKEQEELRTKYALYLDNYTIELARELNAIKVRNPTILSDTTNMDMKALFRNLSKALDNDRSRHAPIGKDLWAFANKNLSSEPYYEMEEVREQFNRWCKNLGSKSTWYEEQFVYWKETKEGFPNPSLIAASINNAYIDIDADTIKQHLVEWTKSVKDAFVMSKNYTIVIEKAQKNFKELFEEESNKGISTLFFYEDILKALFQQNGEKTRLDQLKDSVWEKALLQVIEEKLVANYFGDWRAQYGPYAVKSFNEELDTLLPTTEEIQQALLKSVERKRKISIPEIDIDTLRMDLVIRSPKIDKYENRKKLLVALAYKNYPTTKDGAIIDVLTAVPTEVLVKEGNNKDSKSKVELVSTKIKKTETYKSGSATTTVKLTFVVVTDVEKLFNSMNMDKFNYKGKDLSTLLKKINMGVSVKGAGVMMGVEDFIYKSTNVEYFEIEFSVGNVLLEGKDKVIELQTGVKCNNDSFKVTFGDGSAFLSGSTFLKPTYDYQ